jgi:hypothetical protein
MALSKDEMLENLEALLSATANADEAARDYERSGTRDSLERIKDESRKAGKHAEILEEWHA